MSQVEASPDASLPPAQLEVEKLAALAEFAAGAGHEINNPLAVISGRAQLLLAGERDPERRRELAVIHRQALRIHEMISDLMQFARPAMPEFAEVNVAGLVAGVIKQLSADANEAGVRISVAPIDDSLTIRGDSAQIAVALAAVIVNALQACGDYGQSSAMPTPAVDLPLPTGGEVHISAVKGRNTDDASATVEISVRDDGPGFDATAERHLFDPFFSGRSAGRGLGMGLAKCWRIVTLHGGAIRAANQPERGCEFVITLAAAPSTAP